MLKSKIRKIKIQSPALFKKLADTWRRVRQISDFFASSFQLQDSCLLLDLVVAKPGGNCFGAESELCISRTAQSQRKSIGTVLRAATPLFLFF